MTLQADTEGIEAVMANGAKETFRTGAARAAQHVQRQCAAAQHVQRQCAAAVQYAASIKKQQTGTSSLFGHTFHIDIKDNNEMTRC